RLLQEAVSDLNPPKPPTIPYWNWTYDRDIPSMFLGDFPANPLGNNRRFPSQSLNQVLDVDVNEDKIHDLIYQTSTFTNFGSGRVTELRKGGVGSDLENGPHMSVHTNVGGRDKHGKKSDFLDLDTAAFDPIFWSHHANIDRLWNWWLCIPGHKNPDKN